MIETCGFERLIAKTQEQIFISKTFPKKDWKKQFFKRSLENHDGF
jgi:hypothetical protein